MSETHLKAGKTREAIQHAEGLAEWYRLPANDQKVSLEQISEQLGLLVDRVISEAAIYAPDWAAEAILETEGNITEAAEILRASTVGLPQRGVSETLNTENMFILRRISSAFREIPGGQVLGPTRDYTQRLLEDKIALETDESRSSEARKLDNDLQEHQRQVKDQDPRQFRRVTDLLVTEGLMKGREEVHETQPGDVSKKPLLFPHSRAAALQTLSRSETGGLMAFGYASQRGYGGGHGTVGELRFGRVTVKATDPRGRSRCIGNIKVTECEMVGRFNPGKPGTLPSYSVGYGLCMGQNETKAICMGKLESALRDADVDRPSNNPELVLSHIDGPAASGTIRALGLENSADWTSDLLERENLQIQWQKTKEKTSSKEKANVV